MTIANELKFSSGFGFSRIGRAITNDNVVSIASFRQAWRMVRPGDYTVLMTRVRVNPGDDKEPRDYSFLDDWNTPA